MCNTSSVYAIIDQLACYVQTYIYDESFIIIVKFGKFTLTHSGTCVWVWKWRTRPCCGGIHACFIAFLSVCFIELSALGVSLCLHVMSICIHARVRWDQICVITHRRSADLRLQSRVVHLHSGLSTWLIPGIILARVDMHGAHNSSDIFQDNTCRTITDVPVWICKRTNHNFTYSYCRASPL